MKSVEIIVDELYTIDPHWTWKMYPSLWFICLYREYCHLSLSPLFKLLDGKHDQTNNQ